MPRRKDLRRSEHEDSLSVSPAASCFVGSRQDGKLGCVVL